MHIPSSLVIPQTFPGFQDGLKRCPGKGANVWIFPQPIFIVRDDGVDRRLLEHDFRNPDFVGILRPPPWQVAFSGGVPGEKMNAKRRRIGENGPLSPQ
jgi:hypothetical protein